MAVGNAGVEGDGADVELGQEQKREHVITFQRLLPGSQGQRFWPRLSYMCHILSTAAFWGGLQMVVRNADVESDVADADAFRSFRSFELPI